ncbi:type II toxin-antitoxin system mRNA interferase toxin, RelE/StbE family [uncultured Lactobacillus sp.]|uniref:type II toxin-antitoxin system RelE/ParE family toxin n=1 Tax=uncultured Lactobacillus sp. TaxID=153152 RepID=UPI002804DF6D|nr:type II toxin-antitoxin system mRNA interferase toxin, RelE/StbE family [uncultured Lactobacillus sp.]
MKIKTTPSFKRSIKKYKKKHYNLKLLDECVTAIVKNDLNKLKEHHAHKLTNYYELHILGDWLLEYDFEKETGDLILILIDTGNHDELKRKKY